MREEKGKKETVQVPIDCYVSWLTGFAVISTVCNNIPISSKHFPPQSSIIATQFRMCSYVQLTDRWTD